MGQPDTNPRTRQRRDKGGNDRYVRRMLSSLSLRRPELAIDFGTANLRVIHRDGGILFDEPSLCCFANFRTNPQLFAAGSAAEAMVDRTPPSLQVRRPLRRGVLQDIGTAAELLRYAIRHALGRRQVRGLRALIGVPADATQAERRALLTAADDAGLAPVRLVHEPLAAAVGAGIQINKPAGVLVLECGAGTTEVAVLSLGGICLTRSVRIGGASLNKVIADHLHLRHKILVGAPTAERIKRNCSSLKGGYPSDKVIEVRGRSLVSMAPTSLSISASELDPVIDKHVRQIVEAVRDVLNQTPPELSQDLHEHGALLTGGGALTPRLVESLQKELGLPVLVAEDPAHCVARGLQSALQTARG